MQSIDASPATPGADGDPVVRPTRGSAYAELSRQIKGSGLLNRRPGYYIRHSALLLGLCAVGVMALFAVGDSWWQLLVAAYFAVVSTQLGFLGHDAGHRQIFRTGQANHAVGVVLASLGVGFSYGWWVDKHNRHHAHPNDAEKDPDVAAGALVFTTSARRGQAGASPARSTATRHGCSFRCCCWRRSTCRWPACDTSLGDRTRGIFARRC